MSLRHPFLAPVIVTALAGAAVLASGVCGQQTRPADAPASGVAKLEIAVFQGSGNVPRQAGAIAEGSSRQ